MEDALIQLNTWAYLAENSMKHVDSTNLGYR